MKKTFLTILAIPIFLMGCTDNGNKDTAQIPTDNSNIVEEAPLMEGVSDSEDFAKQTNGDVDTSTWKQCEVGANSFLCPPGWNVFDRGITNVKLDNLNQAFQAGDIEIYGFGAAIDYVAGVSPSLDNLIEDNIKEIKDNHDNCEESEMIDNILTFVCTSKKSDEYRSVLYKIIKTKVGAEYVGANILALGTHTATEADYKKNEVLIDKIIEKSNFF